MPRSQSAQELAEEAFDHEVEQVIQTLAAEQGPPPGLKKLSEADKVRLWGRTDPKVDYDGFVQALMTTGIAPEVAEQMLVVQENEDMLEAYVQPTQDEAVASALAVLAEFPFRVGILSDIDDPDERVAEADRLDRAWSVIAPPEPEMPAEAPMAADPQQPPMPDQGGGMMQGPAPVDPMAPVDVPPMLPGAGPQVAMPPVVGG